jgi:hypothetical protein
LRKFVSNEDGRMITAPERRTYAPGMVALLHPISSKGSLNGLLDSQKNIIGDPTKLAQEFYDEDWVRHGGSYEDTDDGRSAWQLCLNLIWTGEQMLNDLEQAGNMPQDDPDNEDRR